MHKCEMADLLSQMEKQPQWVQQWDSKLFDHLTGEGYRLPKIAWHILNERNRLFQRLEARMLKAYHLHHSELINLLIFNFVYPTQEIKNNIENFNCPLMVKEKSDFLLKLTACLKENSEENQKAYRASLKIFILAAKTSKRLLGDSRPLFDANHTPLLSNGSLSKRHSNHPIISLFVALWAAHLLIIGGALLLRSKTLSSLLQKLEKTPGVLQKHASRMRTYIIPLEDSANKFPLGVCYASLRILAYLSAFTFMVLLISFTRFREHQISQATELFQKLSGAKPNITDDFEYSAEAIQALELYRDYQDKLVSQTGIIDEDRAFHTWAHEAEQRIPPTVLQKIDKLFGP